MSIFGFGLGLVVTSGVMAWRLRVEAKEAQRLEQEAKEPSATHYHVSVEDGISEENLPPYLRERMRPIEEERAEIQKLFMRDQLPYIPPADDDDDDDDRPLDWRGSFPTEDK